MSRAVVIGAGVAGLAVAGLLARDGHEVLVLEKNRSTGGRAGSLERDGFRFDTGPSWYLMPRVFEHFFRMMGTSTAEQLDLVHLDPGYRVFGEPGADGTASTVTVPAGREAAAQLFESMEPGSGERLRRYLDSAQHASAMAERHFLYNPFTRLSGLLHPEVLRGVPRLLSLLIGRLQSFVAGRFRHPLLRQILGYPAVFLGTDPRRAPSMYHLMSALDLDDGVSYPQGGFHRVVERIGVLTREAGAVIRTDAEVTGIRVMARTGRRARVDGVEWVASDGTRGLEHADIIVSAADLHHTETALLPRDLQTYPEAWWRRRVSGPGAVLVMLGVQGGLESIPHHSLFFAADWDANFDAIFGPRPSVPTPASVYVCRPSATDPAVAPAGHENLFVLVPVPADTGIGSGGAEGTGSVAVERAADAAIDLVAGWAGIPDLRDRIVVRETRGPGDFSTDYHSWRGGIPMCLISAELVLKRIRGDHSSGPLPEPTRRPEDGR